MEFSHDVQTSGEDFLRVEFAQGECQRATRGDVRGVSDGSQWVFSRFEFAGYQWILCNICTEHLSCARMQLRVSQSRGISYQIEESWMESTLSAQRAGNTVGTAVVVSL